MLLDEAVQAIAARADLALVFGKALSVGLSLPACPLRPDLLQGWQFDE